MKYLINFIIACTIIGLVWSVSFRKSGKSNINPSEVFVTKIVDGDTIKAKVLPSGKIITIRILGIDCPESHKNQKCKKDGEQGRKDCNWQIPRGLKAAKKAAEWLKAKSVYLECDGACKNDQYKRQLRYVRMENGRDYGLEMVRLGLCEEFGWKYPHPRMDSYRKAQDEAKASGKGIWK